MPRDGSGVYTLPSGNPVVTNTVISSTWANGTMSDIAAQLNNVLTRDGLLGPTGPFKLQDGTVNAPGLAFNSEPGLGMYRNLAGKIGWAQGGTNRFLWDFSAPNATYMQATVASAASGTISFAMANANAGSYNNFVITLSPDNTTHVGNYGAGTNAAGPINYEAASHNFSSRVVAPQFSFPGGLTSWSSDANAVYFQFATGYYWQWANANGALSWVHSGGKTSVFGPSGEFFSASNVWAGNTQDFGLVSSDPTYSILRFAITGWGLFYRKSDGFLSYKNNGGVDLLTVDGVGNVTSYGNLICRSGPAMWQDGGNGSYLSMSGSGPQTTWTWVYDKTTGDLKWMDYLGAENFKITGAGAIFVRVKGYQPGGNMWGDSSDARIKENVENYTTGLDAVLGLRPVTYNFIEETDRDTSIRYTGLIAQEAEIHMPELVTVKDEAVGRAAYSDLRIMDASALTYALVNAIKTLNDRLTALETA